MKLKDFYFSGGARGIPEGLDADCRKKLKEANEELDQGPWTKKQKKVQRNRILPNIALYRTFLQYGIPEREARELVNQWAFYKAEKMHAVLKTFFRLPGSERTFRFLMRKGMTGTEIWESEVLTDSSEKYEVDVTRCLWADTCACFGCPDLCEAFCLSDHILFGNIEKMEFRRTETLGMKGSKCDFCFLFKSKRRL